MPAVMTKPRRRTAQHPAKVASVVVGVACYYGPAAFVPTASPRTTAGKAAAVATPASLGGARAAASQAVAPAAAAFGGALVSAAVVASAAWRGSAARRTASTKHRRTSPKASPDGAELLQHLQEWTSNGGAEELLQHLRHQLPSSFEMVPPAYAAEAAKIELDPNTKYLYGADGAVLVDPMGNKPLVDDWWNGFIGIQKDAIKEIDVKLREAGVPQSFGWTIVLYTTLIKALFYPLQQGQLRTTSLMQLLQPKVKEIQEKYKGDENTQSRLLGELYGSLDVNPLSGCLPTFIQLPIFWSLYGVWRRLYAEKFEHYNERWLFVPDLSQPNPDFQFKLDWLFEFADGRPKMGWEDYLCYLIFPAILVTSTLVQQQQAQASKPSSDGKDDQGLLLTILPAISVYFIGSLSLELPQAVSVYYTTNTLLTAAQTQLVKWSLRQDIPGYEEFEKTGKFPEGTLEGMVSASVPPPESLHEAALRGDKAGLAKLCEEGTYDVNAWDEKQIAPLGYAVACGHLEVVRDLLARGAKIDVLDGQSNTLLHYAAGYGHLDIVQELLEQGKGTWPNDEWKEIKNLKGQVVYDCARVNSKTAVMEFLGERLGLPPPAAEEPEVVPTSVVAAAPAQASAPAAAPSQATAAAAARAALLAAAGGSEAVTAAAPAVVEAEVTSPPPPKETSQDQATTLMQEQLRRLKENPQAVEQAKDLLGKVPPGVLAQLTGGKLSEEQMKTAMEKMRNMSAEELMSAVPPNFPSKPAPVPKEEPPASTPQKVSARSVD